MGLVSQPWFLAAAQLVEGTPIRDIRGVGLDDPALVQLSINENPLGSSPRAIEAVAKSMFGMNRYPFHDQLEEALAKHHDVPMETILTGVGSSEILNLLVLAAFWDRGGNIVTAFPSYPSVPGKTEQLGREVRKIPLEPDYGIDLEAMANAIDSETRIVTICNPNNPTGQLLDAAELRQFIDAVPKDVIVCIDEAYIHFVEVPDYPSTIPLAQEKENVLVTRTFSKAYGLGGVRVGYGIGHPDLLKRLARLGIGRLNKNTLSIAAALGALEDPEHVTRSVALVREGKRYLYAQLEDMGYEPLRTQTIFVTVEVGPDTETFIGASTRTEGRGTPGVRHGRLHARLRGTSARERSIRAGVQKTRRPQLASLLAAQEAYAETGAFPKLVSTRICFESSRNSNRPRARILLQSSPLAICSLG